ncbi:MAG: FtsW/RodA/SpoVE family cell cycle protein [Ruminococcaceae bacterium]|nr:FtsW/RodA/SpoVE family cell cycle protein [Oscillospiraceae bacterium]
MKKIKNYIVHFIKGTDNLLLFLALLTSTFGILAVYSATHYTVAESGGLSRDARTMIIAVILGLVMALVISLIDHDIICKLWFVWAIIGIVFMLLVMSPLGVAPPSRPDSKVWLDLKIFYFQPSELVKIIFIVTFAAHINAVKPHLNKVKTLILLIAHALIPILLVMKSGDDGSALVFMGIAAIMLFISGLNWTYIIGSITLLLAAIPLVWFKFFDAYQKQRFIVIFKPEDYPDTAYQQNMGLSAIGQGGFLGTGFLKGPYTQARAVPESQNDFIFTVVAEEFGTLGGIIAILLICAIIIRVIMNGKKASHGASRIMCYGIGAMIATQSFVNIAMCLRLGPVIGITLPFFSAGGSSSLCLYIGLGLALSAYRTTFDQRPKQFRLNTTMTSPYKS